MIEPDELRDPGTQDPDARILTSMRREIVAYRDGRLPYEALVSDLDTCITVLMNVPDESVRLLREEWLVLQQINAIALDEDRFQPLPSDTALVQATLEKILKVVDQDLQEM